jgi:TatD DNase family protein
VKLIDTHTHLFLNQFDIDRDLVIQNAINKGVTKMFIPNVDDKTLSSVNDLNSKFPENCFPLIGLHPSSVGENFQNILEKFEIELMSEKYYGIGETGIDLYWDKVNLDKQIISFIKHIGWAKKYKLPLIIHARESFDEIFKIIDEFNDSELFGIFHCFTGTKPQAEKIISYNGFKLGIGGVVTYKNSNLNEVLKSVDLKYIVLETDSPYLTPVPFRGKRNESSYLIYIAEKLAEIYGVSIDEIAKETTRNANEIFRIEN